MENHAPHHRQLEQEAEYVLEMLDGFGLLCRDPHESDKNAFISSYIEYRLTQ